MYMEEICSAFCVSIIYLVFPCIGMKLLHSEQVSFAHLYIYFELAFLIV